MKITSYILRNFIYLLLIFTLIYLFIFVSNLKCNPETTEVIIRDTVIKTIYRDFIIPDTIIQNEYIVNYDTIFIKGDTVFIPDVVNDYFASVFYSDTLQNDSLAKIIVNDTIERNRLKNRLTEIEIYNYTKIVTKDVFNVSAGGFVLYSPIYQNSFSVGVCCDLVLKKNSFGVGYGIGQVYMVNYKRKLF